MKTKSALLMFVPVVMLTACHKEYPYVVQRVDNNKITVKDSGKSKTFVVNASRYDHLAYVYPGDTIEYCVNGLVQNLFHGKKMVSVPESGYLKFNKDSLDVRQDRILLAKTRHEIWSKYR